MAKVCSPNTLQNMSRCPNVVVLDCHLRGLHLIVVKKHGHEIPRSLPENGLPHLDHQKAISKNTCARRSAHAYYVFCLAAFLRRVITASALRAVSERLLFFPVCCAALLRRFIAASSLRAVSDNDNGNDNDTLR